MKKIKEEQLDLVKLFYQQDIDFDVFEKKLRERKSVAKNFTTYSLDPYDGEFNEAAKRHLLNRTMVGFAQRHKKDLDGLNLNDTIERIFTEDILKEPVNIYYRERTPEEYLERFGTEDVGPNQPFIDKIATEDNDEFPIERENSVIAVIFQGMLEQPTSIHWKLFLFLHTLVPVHIQSTVFNGKGMFNYIELLFNSCFSSYKEFIYNITINEAMLSYLNLGLSQKETPDENYAREIQELFTQGKRPEAGFTEEDVRGIARCLVGWTFNVDEYNNSEGHESLHLFDPGNHDTGDKYFSSYYNNRVIQGRSGEEGREELSEVVDMIFETEQSSIYVVRRLYQFFVFPIVSEEVEANIIEPLAEVFRDNDFSLVETLKILLKSQHFYSDEIPNSIIKSPIDFQIGIFKDIDLKNGVLHYNPNNGSSPIYDHLDPVFFSDKEKDKSHQWYRMVQYLINNGRALGMDILAPPSVSGWPPFYQNPVYDFFWLNSTTLPARDKMFPQVYIDNKEYGWLFLYPNSKEYFETFENPYDIDSFIEELISRFISISDSTVNRDDIKHTLLQGSNESHWTQYVENQISTAPNKELYASLDVALLNTISLIVKSYEFQLH